MINILPRVCDARPSMQPVTHGWAEHRTADGRAYFTHAATSQTVWTKPLELLSALESVDAQTGWAEVPGEAGKSYFHHKATGRTTWTLPDELRVAREAAAVRRASLRAPQQLDKLTPAQHPAAAVVSQPGPVPQVGAARTQEYATEEEAKEAFKSMLAEAGVSHEDSWEKALRNIVNDPRYGALPSLGRRKAAFNEYCAQRAKQEREERRTRVARVRDGLRAALLAALKEGRLASGARAREAEEALQAHPAWAEARLAQLESRELDGVLSEALAEAEACAREERAERERAAIAALHGALNAADGVDWQTPWSVAAERLASLPSPAWASLSALQCLDAFADWVREGERAAAEREALERESARRAERDARCAFIRLLRAEQEAGRLGPRTCWRDFAPTLAEQPAYLAVCANASGSRPRELFQDLLDEQGDALSEQTRAVDGVLRGRDAEADAQPGAEEEVASLLLAAGGAAAAVVAGGEDAGRRANLRLILADRAEAAREHRARGERRARDAFLSLLRARPLTVGTPWETLQPELATEKAYLELPGGDVTAASLFQEHAAALIASGAEPGEVVILSGRGAGGRRREKRRRKHHSSSSSSSSSSSRSHSRGRGRGKARKRGRRSRSADVKPSRR